jgi:serine/threonine protein kinase
MASASAPVAEIDQKLAMKNSKIEDYDVLQQVGSGTFCVVRLCRFKKNGKICVVKILKKKKICYLKQVIHVTQVRCPLQCLPLSSQSLCLTNACRPLQEVEILRTIDHPFVVRLFHTFQATTAQGCVQPLRLGHETCHPPPHSSFAPPSQDADNLYMVLEFACGGDNPLSLSHFVKSRDTFLHVVTSTTSRHIPADDLLFQS